MKVNASGGTASSPLLIDSYHGTCFESESSGRRADRPLVTPVTGSDPAFKSTGSDQAAHDSDFEFFINYTAAPTLKDAVTAKLRDLSVLSQAVAESLAMN